MALVKLEGNQQEEDLYTAFSRKQDPVGIPKMMATHDSERGPGRGYSRSEQVLRAGDQRQCSHFKFAMTLDTRVVRMWGSCGEYKKGLERSTW